MATAKVPSSTATPKATSGPLSPKELSMLDAYWRALNYLSVGRIYLLNNPLLREPFKREHIKPRLLGHWGNSPGLNMLCVHLNRVIKRNDLNDASNCLQPHGKFRTVPRLRTLIQ